eukprot:TRINITY_DN78326_c0_g1_i1.p1 TRINITY_DN78326_c0_g1~~TRINITY_DN78326_c0_g1_i1.p1  ORF type:complete len:713 (+),score=125.50 TRINITY_DN78326_c0_g1_i1:69-2207(+)
MEANTVSSSWLARADSSISNISVGSATHGDEAQSCEGGHSPVNIFRRKKLTTALRSFYKSHMLWGRGSSTQKSATQISVFLPSTFTLPRSVVKRALQNVDQRDSPDSPGEMKIRELLAAVRRFHAAFKQSREPQDDEELLKALGIGSQSGGSDPDKLVNWNVDAVFSSFAVKLGRLEKLYLTLDMGENSCLMSLFTSIFIFLAVMFSILLWIAGTMEDVRVAPCEGHAVNVCVPKEPFWMERAETVCVSIFTAEILLRLLAAPQARREILNQRYMISLIAGESSDYRPPATNVNRLASFVLSVEAICDILSVIPFWVEMAIDSSGEQVEELSVLRILYVARVTRIFKLGRALNADLGQFNEVHDLFRKVMVNASPAILMTVLLIVIALFFFGTFIWFCERGRWVPAHDPAYQELVSGLHASALEKGAFVRLSSDGLTEELSPFDSIPSAFWWTVVTITTVGYGDHVPHTPWGKTVGGVAMLYGTVILGLPLFVVGATFGQEYDRLMKAAKRRQELQAARAGMTTLATEDRVAQLAKATGNFIKEHALFTSTVQEASAALGIPEQLCSSWQQGLRAALLDPMPSVALDQLTVRVLNYMAETQDMWLSKGATALDEVAACRRICLSWHRLSVTCCQLGMVPPDMLAKVLDQCLGGVSGKLNANAKKSRVPSARESSPEIDEPGSCGLQGGSSSEQLPAEQKAAGNVSLASESRP